MTWRVSWIWSPPSSEPRLSRRKMASETYASEAEARDKVTSLREMAAELGATVAASIKQEGAA